MVMVLAMLHVEMMQLGGTVGAIAIKVVQVGVTL